MLNQQTPERPTKGDGRQLDVHSIFYTIQGEGPYSGHRAVFLRLAGCNLQCPGCDTEYTQGRETRNALPVSDEVTRLAKNNGADRCLVVITGGEPLRQPIGYIVRGLLAKGHPVQIESNGTCAPDETLETLLRDTWYTGELKLVVSPKTKHIHSKCYELAAAFKYVLDYREVSEEDGLPKYALEHRRGNGVARPRKGAPVYLTPYDTGYGVEHYHNIESRLAVARSCTKFGYIAGLQIHKLLGVA